MRARALLAVAFPIHFTQALSTAAGTLNSASNAECGIPCQSTTVLGAHAFAEGNNNSMPSVIAATRTGVVGACSGSVAAASVLPADAVDAGRHQEDVKENCSNDSMSHDVNITGLKPSFCQGQLKSASPHLLAVPVTGGAARCEATVAVACVPGCVLQSSCVGLRSVMATTQPAKRTGLDACDVGKATANVDSSHKEPCKKRTCVEQETVKVKSMPLIALQALDAEATEQSWIAALIEALATPIDDTMLLASSVEAFPHASPVAMPTTNASAVAGSSLQQPRHFNAIPVPVSSASSVNNASARGRPAKSAFKACASTFSQHVALMLFSSNTQSCCTAYC